MNEKFCVSFVVWMKQMKFTPQEFFDNVASCNYPMAYFNPSEYSPFLPFCLIHFSLSLFPLSFFKYKNKMKITKFLLCCKYLCLTVYVNIQFSFFLFLSLTLSYIEFNYKYNLLLYDKTRGGTFLFLLFEINLTN
jgi:hypothetical protein